MILNRRRFVFLIFAIATVCIGTSEYKTSGLLRHFKGLFKSTVKRYRNGGSPTQAKITDLTTRNELEFELDGSLVPVMSTPFSVLSDNSAVRENGLDDKCGCCRCTIVAPATSCTRTCLSSEYRCGRPCAINIVFNAVITVDANGNTVIVETTDTSYGSNCPGLPCYTLITTTTEFETETTTETTTITEATSTEVYVTTTVTIAQTLTSFSTATVVPVGPAIIGAVAAFAAGVGVCINGPSTPDPVDIEPFIIIGPETPENNLEIPVEKEHFLDDGCESNSVRFKNGSCTPLLRRGPCASPYHWVTIDPVSLQGRCTPRLCGRGRVFVGRDGLCHDKNDPNECRGGRRLHYSAFGDPMCDCPIGQYPFPGQGGDCVALFTQGPCPIGSVVNINEANRLVCMPAQCESIQLPGSLPFQMIPLANGRCFALGTRGPCSASHLLGYDIFERKAVCANMEDPTSPYFSSPEEDAIIDHFYNQDSQVFNNIRVVLFKQNALKRNDTSDRRQGSGVFQFPSRLPDSLLNSCRPGDRGSFNYKCSNPLVPNNGIRDTQQAVQSPYRCQSNNFLQATGQCSNDDRGSSCGPSHRYNPNTGQCRPIFR